MVQKAEKNIIIIELQKINKVDKKDLINTVNKSHNLSDLKKNFIISLMVFYLCKDITFMIANYITIK